MKHVLNFPFLKDKSISQCKILREPFILLLFALSRQTLTRILGLKLFIGMRFYLFFLILVIVKSISSQNLRMPLDIAPCLGGNFGELRPNHFHMGLDFKTNGKENLPIYAVADGELSRVLISPNGYGKALYIDHKNLGITTVYAHLNSFIPEIENLVSQIQYQLKSNTLDTLFSNKTIKIKKGQIIAYSGNTGGSEGPHLHFEIRNTQTEHTINPLLYYPNIVDNLKPILSKIFLYNLSKDFSIIHSEYAKNEINSTKIHTNLSQIGIGVAAYDIMNNTSSKFGIYKIVLFENDNLKYKIVFDSLDFENQGYVNFVGDQYKRPDDVYRVFEAPCTKNIFKNFQNGFISLATGETKNIRIEVYDFKENISKVSFTLIYDKHEINLENKDTNTTINCTIENEVKTRNIDFIFPENTFSNSVEGNFKSLPIQNSEIYRFKLFDFRIPALNKYQIHFKNIPSDFQDFLYLKCKNPKSTKTWIGQWTHGVYIVDGVKTFGEFSLCYDILKPKIEVLKINQNQSLLLIKIIDKESGIKYFNLYSDGEWQKVYYDEKNDLLNFEIPKNDNKLNHSILINVEDKVGNINSKTIELFY